MIVYEDEHLLVINKPAGMVVHPAPGHASGTLVNALLHRFALPALQLDADGLAVSAGEHEELPGAHAGWSRVHLLVTAAWYIAFKGGFGPASTKGRALLCV